MVPILGMNYKIRGYKNQKIKGNIQNTNIPFYFIEMYFGIEVNLKSLVRLVL